jgi:hypothetical protein
MSAKAIVSGAVILALLGGWASLVAAQPPMPPTPAPAPAPPVESLPAPSTIPGQPVGLPAAPTIGDGLPPGSVTDPWIDYTRPGCCGPIGRNGPIGSEWFLRNGVTIPVAGGILNDALQTGYMTEFGARALFFNPNTDKAWTLSSSLSYSYNNSSRSDLILMVPEGFNSQNPVTGQTQFQITDIPVTIRDYQRWSFNVAGGRERYIGNPAYSPGWHWRIGSDLGGRWGYGRVGLNDLTGLPDNIFYRRQSDVFGSFFVALHSDVEGPLFCGHCQLISGIRAEWNYTWTDVLPQSKNDLQDVNLLWTIGWRY